MGTKILDEIFKDSKVLRKRSDMIASHLSNGDFSDKYAILINMKIEIVRKNKIV